MMMKAISEKQLKDCTFNSHAYLDVASAVKGFYDSLDPCYTKKQVYDVLRKLNSKSITHNGLYQDALLDVIHELEKIGGLTWK